MLSLNVPHVTENVIQKNFQFFTCQHVLKIILLNFASPKIMLYVRYTNCVCIVVMQ